MTVTGIHHVLVRTTDYAGTLAFWQGLGFTVDFETGHGSAKVDPPTAGPYVFVDTVEPGHPVGMELYLDVADHTALSGVMSGVMSGVNSGVNSGGDEWEATHWGTFVRPVVDPDGRTVWLQEVGPDGH